MRLLCHTLCLRVLGLPFDKYVDRNSTLTREAYSLYSCHYERFLVFQAKSKANASSYFNMLPLFYAVGTSMLWFQNHSACKVTKIISFFQIFSSNFSKLFITVLRVYALRIHAQSRVASMLCAFMRKLSYLIYKSSVPSHLAPGSGSVGKCEVGRGCRSSDRPRPLL